jgi:acyl-CoA thioester hydrolase/1,4-dihydroxy-2-naphthoyl-CoA hydrolase
MAFLYKTFIPFHMADGAGVLFFGHVFTLAHDTYEHFIREGLDLTWEWWFQNSEWMVPIRHAESDYQRPLLVGQACHIKLQLGEIRKSSFTLLLTFSQNEQECCTVKITHVFCNRLTKKAQSIPSAIRDLLSGTYISY